MNATKKGNEKRHVPLSAHVEPGLARQVQEAAKRAGLSIHAWVRRAVQDHLSDSGVKPDLIEVLLPHLGGAAIRALDRARDEGEAVEETIREAIRQLGCARGRCRGR